MEFTSNWGRPWTYALVSSIVILGGIIAFMLSDERRDADAAAFDYVSALNENQLFGVQGYVLAMPDGQIKTDLSAMLDTIHIIRNRKEIMYLDSVRVSEIDTTAISSGIVISEVKYQNNKYVMTIEGLDSSLEQCFQTNILMNAIEHGDVDVTGEICVPAQ